MKYYELYKTASIYKNGLAILDVSPNLTDEEIREIDKIIGYKTVFSLGNLSIQEIREKYPKNYAYYQLTSSGRKILFLSNYTGMANHTPNRPGSYFSHVVIFEDKNLNFSLRKFLSSFEWKEILTLEEDNNYKPSLGTKELNIIDDESVFIDDFNHFQNFLSNNNRLFSFSKIIDNIFTFRILDKGQNITIIDSKDNLIDWVLSVNYFLPKDLADKITFASYVGSPENYPFKLTAILPECQVPINNDYFVVFDVKDETFYEPKSLYTIEIVKFIKENDFNSWHSFINKIINTKYDKLISFLEKYNFNEGIGNTSSIEIYKEKFSSLSFEEKKEIWSNAYTRDLDLYNKIVIHEMVNTMSSFTNNDYKQLFLKIYIDFVEGKEEYRKLYFDDLIETFLENINTTYISNDFYYYILTNSNCNTNSKKQLKYFLEKIDSDYQLYYENNVEDSFNKIIELDKQYKINLLDFHIPNIQKIMKFKEIIQEAKKDNFINEIRKHNDFLQNATVKEKRKLFLIAFNNDKYFLKKNFKNFSNYIEIIYKNLGNESATFWAYFFDKNKDYEKDKDYSYHSLSYLKKRFVADIFLLEIENLEILEKIDFTDKYTMKWIDEAVKEGTDRESILKLFLDYFNNNRHIDNNTSWFSKLFNK